MDLLLILSLDDYQHSGTETCFVCVSGQVTVPRCTPASDKPAVQSQREYSRHENAQEKDGADETGQREVGGSSDRPPAEGDSEAGGI